MAKKVEAPQVTKAKKSVKGRELVYQGNPLIQSRKDFTTFGTRLFILGLMTLNPHLSKNDKYFDKEFPSVHISAGELTKLFGDSKYLSFLKAECDKLFNSHITLDYTNGGFKLMHVFDVLEYLPNDGLYIQFDPKMKPYLLELVEGGYTAINIEQIFKLSSTYAVRLLEVCLQYRNMTKSSVIERKMTEKEIRFYLNVPDDAYSGRLDNFKKYVLDEPIAEIAKITDFRMSYRVEKEGRRIKRFIFELDLSRIVAETFDVNFTLGKKLLVPAPYFDVQGELISQGFTAKAAKEILTKVRDNVEVGLRLEYALKILPEYDKKNPIKNKQGFLRKAILENWRKNDIKSKNEMNISEVSKVKNKMKLNVLDFEKEKHEHRIAQANKALEQTGIKQSDLQGEERPLNSYALKFIKDEMQKGTELSAEAKLILEAFDFTPERFKQVYMKNDEVTEVEARKGGMASLADVLAHAI